MVYARRLALWASLSICGAAPAFAQDEQAALTACESDLRYGEFDFWLGDWEVFAGDKKIGDNSISKEEGGCLVLEKWTDANGGTGQSYNFYNPDSEKWRQVWVSNVMTIDYSGGLTDEGSMELVGEITYFHDSKTLRLLGRWTPLDDGTVRQYFEQYDEEKAEMVPIFTAIYRRKDQDPE